MEGGNGRQQQIENGKGGGLARADGGLQRAAVWGGRALAWGRKGGDLGQG